MVCQPQLSELGSVGRCGHALTGGLDLMTSEQIRDARSFLRMTVADLAQASGVGVATMKRLDAYPGLQPVHARTLDAIERALVSAGIKFIGTPEGRPWCQAKQEEFINLI